MQEASDQDINQQNLLQQRNRKLFAMAFLHIIILWIVLRGYFGMHPNAYHYYNTCPKRTSTESLTFIKEAKCLIVSAYRDHREGAFIHVISIINHDLQTPLYCKFCCTQDTVQSTAAKVTFHTVQYGFPYRAASIFCPEQPSCNATHVSVSPSVDGGSLALPSVPLQNKEIRDEGFPFDITVCFSNALSGENNNILQMIQIIEIYKLLGVQKMFIYNNSCGPEMEKVLQYYQKEHSLDVISWPIDEYIESHGEWSFKGEVHNYGQLTIMNDCIYRNMDQSRYVLLADLDQIIVPYKHATLPSLLRELQNQHSDVTEFLFETHIFPISVSDDEQNFDHPTWRSVPGVNILKHVYKIPVEPDDFKSTKMIVNPRAVKQSAVFYVLHKDGGDLRVPNNMGIVLKFSDVELGGLAKENLTMDYRVWDFGNQLVPEINEVLEKSGVTN
ncbi:uncharacterized protein LOC143488763 [Brachyhypopomus gauderio]|uniref:uncharacterized protein LOC143488763 n=1 Tax=Brachyhypopomus gauderio TaxID=698409 RepID=UPI0040414DCD